MVNQKKQNCWEFKRCGREPRGKRVHELCACPAAVIGATHDGKYNGGEKLGRKCWRAPGTLCDEKIQGRYKDKMELCAECSFYKLVKEEEGSNFVE